MRSQDEQSVYSRNRDHVEKRSTEENFFATPRLQIAIVNQDVQFCEKLLIRSGWRVESQRDSDEVTNSVGRSVPIPTPFQRRVIGENTYRIG